MKLRWCFTWIVDDEVVYVIVVNYIRNVRAFAHTVMLRKTFLSSFTTLWFASLSEAILLAWRSKTGVIITLLCHWILRKLSFIWLYFFWIWFETFLFFLRIQLFWKISFFPNNDFRFKICFWNFKSLFRGFNFSNFFKFTFCSTKNLSIRFFFVKQIICRRLNIFVLIRLLLAPFQSPVILTSQTLGLPINLIIRSFSFIFFFLFIFVWLFFKREL